jgi:hypothetical protein
VRRAEAKKKLDQELLKMKERMEAEKKRKAEEEELKAGNGMMLAMPGDITRLGVSTPST